PPSPECHDPTPPPPPVRTPAGAGAPARLGPAASRGGARRRPGLRGDPRRRALVVGRRQDRGGRAVRLHLPPLRGLRAPARGLEAQPARRRARELRARRLRGHRQLRPRLLRGGAAGGPGPGPRAPVPRHPPGADGADEQRQRRRAGGLLPRRRRRRRQVQDRDGQPRSGRPDAARARFRHRQRAARHADAGRCRQVPRPGVQPRAGAAHRHRAGRDGTRRARTAVTVTLSRLRTRRDPTMNLRLAVLSLLFLPLLACSQQEPAADAAGQAPTATQAPAAAPAGDAPAPGPAAPADAAAGAEAGTDAPAPPPPPVDPNAGASLVEGRDYVRIGNGQPFEPLDGKIEVVEVFGYVCPACANFQPLVRAWQAKLPSDVRFTYVPALFGGTWDDYARAFYTAESMGLVDRTHDPMYQAIHLDRTLKGERGRDSVEDIAAFYGKFGVDPKQFASTMS